MCKFLPRLSNNSEFKNYKRNIAKDNAEKTTQQETWQNTECVCLLVAKEVELIQNTKCKIKK